MPWLVASIALVALMGCGGPSSVAPTAHAACSLVTSREAGRLIGSPLQTTIADTEEVGTCFFNPPAAGQYDNRLAVYTLKGVSSNAYMTMVGGACHPAGVVAFADASRTCTTLNGIGDRADWLGLEARLASGQSVCEGTLNVLKRGVRLWLVVWIKTVADCGALLTMVRPVAERATSRL